MKFCLTKWDIYNRSHIEWLLIIDDMTTLMNYMKFRSGMLMNEYFKIKKKKYAYHCTSNDERMVEATFDFSGVERNSVVDDCKLISDKLLNVYMKVFFDRGSVLITYNNAIRPITDYTILKTTTKSEFNWPTTSYTEKDIKITRWPRGKHYYAKVGKLEVKDKDGSIKWSTEDEAIRQAKLFLSTLNTREKC